MGGIVPVDPGGFSEPLIFFPLHQNAKSISSCEEIILEGKKKKKDIILNLFQLLKKITGIGSFLLLF